MQANVRREEGDWKADSALLHEFDDLGDKRLVGLLQGDRVTSLTEGFFGGAGTPSSHNWALLRLSAAGEDLVRLTGAADIEAAELDAVVAVLCATSNASPSTAS